jgi:hypothetical protein
MLEPKAAKTVFGLVENNGGRTTHRILTLWRCNIRRQIEDAELLEAVGLALEATDMDDYEDFPVAVEWNPDLGAYAYFSGKSGWVIVPEEEMRIYAVRMEQFFGQLFGAIDLGQPKMPRGLIDDTLWEIGDIRLNGRARRLPTWFAKRLNVPSVQEQVVDIANRHPPDGLRLLLTSTRHERLQKFRLPGHLIISVHDVLDLAGGLAIQPDILAARVDQVPLPEISAPIWLSPDGRKLIINGKVIVNFRSKIHVDIISMLVGGYRDGKRFSARELLDHAQSSAKALHQAFGPKRWAQLSPHLVSENGLWGFQP